MRDDVHRRRREIEAEVAALHDQARRDIPPVTAAPLQEGIERRRDCTERDPTICGLLPE